MASQPGKSRSLANRIRRFLKRHLSKRLGPVVTSVQGLSNKEFLGLFSLEEESSGTSGAISDEVLLQHFSMRIEADWPSIPNILTDLRIDLSEMTDKEIIERADRALSGDLHPSGIRPKLTGAGRIDWSTNPSDSREWLLMIHRHAWWSLWGAAYQRTGDEKYAAAFVSQLTDWIEQHPLPRQKSEHSESWRLMEAGLRMRVSWIPVFRAFFDSPHFTDTVKLKMLRAICDHGRFLSRFHTNRNHLVRESNGLIAVGLSFPEFRDSASWVEAGLQRLDEELRAQVNKDGSHIEMSVGYQWLTIDEFEVTRSLLSRHGKKLPTSDLDESLHRLYSFLAGVIRPDRTFPQLNDGFILWGADRMRNAARHSGWSDIEYVASGGAAGSRPHYCSQSFPDAGLHIMRSDWNDNARYLAFDTGPYGGPHGHEDMLSFELSAYGAPFIVDPGSYTYQKNDPYRNYFVGSAGHNTVLVDQMSQIRRWGREHMTPAVRNDVYGTWQPGRDVDFASGQYDDGYAPFALTKPDGATIGEDVVHQRDIIFVKPDYWVVVDYLAAAEAHDYDFLFHLAPDVVTTLREADNALCHSKRNGAQLSVRGFSTGTLSSDELIGAESPIQGWYSSDHHKKVPSPTLIFRCRGGASVCVAWLLCPLPPGAEADSVQASLISDPDSSDLQIEVRYQDRIDVISIRNDQMSRKIAGRTPASDIFLNRNGEKCWSVGQEEISA